MPLVLSHRDRSFAAALVVLVHLAAVWLVLRAHTTMTRREGPALATFDVVRLPPPQPTPIPTPTLRAPHKAVVQGLAGARATPVIAPTPAVPLPPAPTVPSPPQPDRGTGIAAGTANAGISTGSGSAGAGSGGGGGARARLIKGAIRWRDYPSAEREAHVQGVVTVTFTVGVDGRARDCAVARSSGSVALDAITCRLIAERFRYTPATDAAGHAIAEVRGWQQRWWIADDPTP